MSKTLTACPPFCITKNDSVGCGDHHSDLHHQPATAGDYTANDGFAGYPLIITNAMLTSDGIRGVCMLVSDPTAAGQFRPGSTEAKMTIAEARHLATDLLILADLAEAS